MKSAAKACGGKHGGAGQKVYVKLSIQGSTGRVSSSTAKAPHAGTPLGNCVAAELKKAKFKQFKQAQMGFTYGVKM